MSSYIQVVDRSRRVAVAAGCDPTGSWNSGGKSAILECMRAKSWQDLRTVMQQREFAKNEYWQLRATDGGLLPSSFAQLARRRKNVPMLVGTTKDEYAMTELIAPLFAPNAPPYTRKAYTRSDLVDTCAKIALVDYYGAQSGVELQRCVNSLPTGGDTSADAMRRAIIDLGSTAFYHSAVDYELKLQLRRGNRQVYAYSFDYSSDSNALFTDAGAFHNYDIYFVEDFIGGFYRQLGHRENGPIEERMVKRWNGYLGKFILTGSPAPAGVMWPAVMSAERGPVMSVVDSPNLIAPHNIVATAAWTDALPCNTVYW